MNLGQRRAIQREFGEVSKAYTRRVDPRGEREARQIVAWVRPRRHDWALDAACGSGRLARAIARRAALVCGLDLCQPMIKLAREAQAAASRPVLLAIGDLERVPYPSGSFHLVTCSYAFANLPDPGKALGELARVTHGGGRIAIIDLVAPQQIEQRTYLNRLERLRGRLPTRIRSLLEFKNLFRRADLRLESCRLCRRRRRFRDWLRSSPAATRHPERARHLRQMLLDSIADNKAGLQPRRLPSDIEFWHTTAWFMLRTHS